MPTKAENIELTEKVMGTLKAKGLAVKVRHGKYHWSTDCPRCGSSASVNQNKAIVVCLGCNYSSDLFELAQALGVELKLPPLLEEQEIPDEDLQSRKHAGLAPHSGGWGDEKRRTRTGSHRPLSLLG